MAKRNVIKRGFKSVCFHKMIITAIITGRTPVWLLRASFWITFWWMFNTGCFSSARFDWRRGCCYTDIVFCPQRSVISTSCQETDFSLLLRFHLALQKVIYPIFHDSLFGMETGLENQHIFWQHFGLCNTEKKPDKDKVRRAERISRQCNSLFIFHCLSYLTCYWQTTSATSF